MTHLHADLVTRSRAVFSRGAANPSIMRRFDHTHQSVVSSLERIISSLGLVAQESGAVGLTFRDHPICANLRHLWIGAT